MQDADGAEVFEDAIDDELAREARAFDALARTRGRELDLLRLAAIMTHNAGDVDQGLSARGGKKEGAAQRARFARLAHEGPERYGGAFARAAALYKDLMAAEGHRNYPLRELRALRRDPALLLPISPFLDDWGERLARHPAWSLAERAEVVAGVVAGCAQGARPGRLLPRARRLRSRVVRRSRRARPRPPLHGGDAPRAQGLGAAPAGRDPDGVVRVEPREARAGEWLGVARPDRRPRRLLRPGEATGWAWT